MKNIAPASSLAIVPVFFFLALTPAWALPFKGEVDLDSRQAVFAVSAPSGPPVVLRISQGQGKDYQFSADIKNLRTPFFDIATVVEGNLDIVRAPDKQLVALLGKVRSRYTLVDGKPIDELSGQMEIRDGVIRINSLNLGSFSCQGEMALASPHKMNLVVDFRSINFDEIINSRSRELVKGLTNIDGNIIISGALADLFLRGKLASYAQNDSGDDYLQALINFSGKPEDIVIANSSVSKPDGMIFSLSGKLNLKDYKSFPQQIDALVKEPLVSQRGDQYEWTLKKVESQNRSGSTELKYLLRKGEDRSDPTRADTGMLGVERKMEF